MSETPGPDFLDSIAVTLLEKACDGDLRIATAESCTGGLIAALLTDVDGLSHAFERGFVVYDEKAKVEMLGLDAKRLEAESAVSEWTARAMAEGALRHSGADIAIAVTGYAGPAKDDAEEGLVHLAVARRRAQSFDVRHKEAHYGAAGRQAVRAGAARDALQMACKVLE
jgi:nicotinamide-nucleotide amidase